MLSKNHRLAKTKDVQLAFVKGRGFFNPYFTVKFLKNKGENKRFTVVVSTKVSKQAVKRNRIKRVIREFVRINMADFVPGDYAIVAKPAAQTLRNPDILDNFRKLIITAKVFRPKEG
jgi:ribonuclease P protein component